VKYFTKLFIRHTGLKPNEFRKIFAWGNCLSGISRRNINISRLNLK
jgi:hypothetical protein